jgi:hypothetical protein
MLALVESLNNYSYKTFNKLKGFLYPLVMSTRPNVYALTYMHRNKYLSYTHKLNMYLVM